MWLAQHSYTYTRNLFAHDETHRELNVLAGLAVFEVGRGGDDVVVELDRRRAQEYHMREELCRVVENLQSLEKNTQLSFFTMG